MDQPAKEAKAKGFKLPDDVDKVYKVRKGVLPQFADSELGYVDLTTISLKNAERVSGRGYLVKK